MNRFNYILSTLAALLMGFGVYAQDITHPASGSANFSVDPGQTVMYYDNGGSGCDGVGSYSNGLDATAVICPSQAGETITIEFVEVDIEVRTNSSLCWDFLRVYNGNGVSFGSLLFEGCGEDGFTSCPGGNPGDGGDGGGIEAGPNDLNGSADANPANNIFTSTDASGCLTVNFDTDGSVDEGGWVAVVTSTGGGGGGPTCDDGIQNGNETGVDCGGPDCAPCVVDPPVTGCGDLQTVEVEISFDDFAGETSWNLTQDGSTIASGGGYTSADDFTTLTEEICVPDGCYEFTIFDSFGDGICCSFGAGSYSVSDGTTGEVFGSGGAFGSSETTEFCIGECQNPPVVTFSETSFCSSGNFYVFVDVASLGDNSNIDIVSSEPGTRQYLGASQARTYIMGPFEVGNDVEIYITGVQNALCEVISPTFSGDCGSALIQQGSTAPVGEMAVFPNPTLGELNVNLTNFHGQQVDIVIYDAVGRVVANRQVDQVDTAVESFDLSGEQAGMYMVTVKGAEAAGMLTERFIISGRP
jgi:hypothetical protein